MIETEYIVPIPELLRRHAAASPDKQAFRDAQGVVTYRELYERTGRLAGHLRDLGLESGGRMLMYLDNGIPVAEGYLVAPRAGTVTVSANPTATEAELSYMLDDSGARVIMTDEPHLQVVLTLAASRPDLLAIILTGTRQMPASGVDTPVVLYDDLLASRPRSSPPDDVGLDDWCWMLYTSGTTGRPKGVRLCQRGCLWVVAACWAPIAGLGPDDHLLGVLPLFHSYALVLCVLGVAATQATATLLPRYSPTDVVRRLAEDGITFFPGVPTMFKYLLNVCAPNGPLDAPDLRVCVSAGAILSGTLNQEFEQYAGVPLLDGYGITETSTMVTLNSPRGTRVPGSCGLPLPGLTVRLVGAEGVDVLPGDEGELWVQGPNVMLGYHNMPDATADVVTRGWYRTGDLARRDEHGFVTISGRVKEIIIRAGENIAPAEVEDVVVSSPCVEDVAVLGIPHEDLGEVPVACVVVVGGMDLDREDILSRCRDRLAYFKVPAEVIEVPTIPRTGSGKIQRHHLRGSLEQRSEIS